MTPLKHMILQNKHLTSWEQVRLGSHPIQTILTYAEYYIRGLWCLNIFIYKGIGRIYQQAELHLLHLIIELKIASLYFQKRIYKIHKTKHLKK